MPAARSAARRAMLRYTLIFAANAACFISRTRNSCKVETVHEAAALKRF